MRFLPIAVGFLVPKYNVAWRIFLKFVFVVRFVICPNFSETDLLSLQEAIEDLIGCFFSHYSHLRVTPKFHYLLHYPSQIRKHGALFDITTLRFESKNSQVKTFAKTSKCFRNICKTIAKKHQQWISLRIAQQDFFSWKIANDGEVELSSIVDKVAIQGTSYAKGDIVAFIENGEPMFGEIEVVHISESYDFRCKKMPIMEFDNHVAAYVVKASSESVTVPHKELIDYRPTCLYGGRYVVPYHLLQKPSHDTAKS